MNTPMNLLSETEFNALAAQGYNRIALMTQIYADLDTPLSIYLKLAGTDKGSNSCLLESVVGGERFGRYSFIGLPAKTLIRATGSLTEVVARGKVVETFEGDPLAFIEQYQARFKVAMRPGMPRFAGGLAGYFGYDTVRHIEPRLGPCTKPSPVNPPADTAKGPDTGGLHASGLHAGGAQTDIPDILLLHIDELAVVDNLAGCTWLLIYADPREHQAWAKAQRRLKELRGKLRAPITIPYAYASQPTQAQRSFKKEDYLNAVRRAKEYIAAGDLMQVQIGQVITQPYRDEPLSLYRALRSLNPSPYMYYWNFDHFHVVGASPEILVRQEVVGASAGESVGQGEQNSKQGGKPTRQITIRPLAGTRPRGNTPEADARLAAELQADPKERAEHVMLIDLARNDIGRVAKTGSVKVTDTMSIERYSHVMHLVSNVTGELKDGLGNMDVLRAAFPAGTLTGAPKVRAMEIIDELEPVRRGIYGGAAGYLSYGGQMDVAIAIRTGIIKDDTLYVQAAAGIVADSDPETEWQETEAKARAVLRAAEQVQAGLDEPI